MGERKAGVYWDEVWNPLVGCTKVSAGCANCWAERFAWRHVNNTKTAADYAGVADANGWTGQVNLLPHRLSAPLRWRKPRVVSVQFQGDLFNEAVPDEYILRVFEVMLQAPRHTFLVLTKRARRMLDWFVNYGLVPFSAAGHTPSGEQVPTNAWLGVSVEDQPTANERIPLLLQTPAAKRFVSCEPLLGPVDLNDLKDGETFWTRPAASMERSLDWVICGGESGPHRRTVNFDCYRSLRDQCAEARVPFWLKQTYPGSRDLDGRTWDEVPS